MYCYSLIYDTYLPLLFSPHLYGRRAPSSSRFILLTAARSVPALRGARSHKASFPSLHSLVSPLPPAPTNSRSPHARFTYLSPARTQCTHTQRRRRNKASRLLSHRWVWRHVKQTPLYRPTPRLVFFMITNSAYRSSGRHLGIGWPRIGRIARVRWRRLKPFLLLRAASRASSALFASSAWAI